MVNRHMPHMLPIHCIHSKKKPKKKKNAQYCNIWRKRKLSENQAEESIPSSTPTPTSTLVEKQAKRHWNQTTTCQYKASRNIQRMKQDINIIDTTVIMPIPISQACFGSIPSETKKLLSKPHSLMVLNNWTCKKTIKYKLWCPSYWKLQVGTK